MVDNDEIKDIDEKFVGQFLINGTVRQPIESMMIPTASIKELTENIRNNKTYCFQTDPGPFGWCATCKGFQYISQLESYTRYRCIFSLKVTLPSASFCVEGLVRGIKSLYWNESSRQVPRKTRWGFVVVADQKIRQRCRYHQPPRWY